MTRDELVDHICVSTGYNETDDIAACRKFAKQRDQMIYDSALWKSALVIVPISVDPTNNLDHAAGVVLLPEVISRAVALRSTVNAIRVNALEEYYRVDLDKFAEQSNPFEFSPMSPTWLTVRPKSDYWEIQELNHVIPSHADLSCAVGDLIKFVNDTGQQINIDDTTQAIQNVPDGETVYFEATNTTIRFNLSIGSDNSVITKVYIGSSLLTNQSPGPSSVVVIASSTPSSDTQPAKVIWRDAAGKRYEVNQALPITLTPDDDAGYFDIEAIFKPTTTGTVSVTLKSVPEASNIQTAYLVEVVLETLAATATRTASYQRLRLFGMPTQSVTLNALGKGKYQPLDYATQEPFLRNAENVLIAYTRGDLLRRGGENGNAQTAYQEAGQLLQQLKDLEAYQEANNQRIQPDGGYGPEFGLGPYTRPYF